MWKVKQLKKMHLRKSFLLNADVCNKVGASCSVLSFSNSLPSLPYPDGFYDFGVQHARQKSKYLLSQNAFISSVFMNSFQIVQTCKVSIAQFSNFFYLHGIVTCTFYNLHRMQFCSVSTCALLLFNHEYRFYLLDTGLLSICSWFQIWFVLPPLPLFCIGLGQKLKSLFWELHLQLVFASLH